ncbi:putative murein hydrolase (TIGR00659 family) [Cytobacillus horneckiae]|uniref:LrgB family protein n=1 Tax=Cytobacillus horneckiae TaxID=549687 RepID=UPI0019D19800|nr:LrgB family protein [Cytobacillus horneckiae]MBN6889188.1 LrgB family protein [Cytobacillus horneckiae]MCM3178406.1 LrgB family protein [Cytobacillus horneckiae]
MKTLFFLSLTISIYFISKWAYGKTNKIYFSPLVIAPLVIIMFLILFNIPYSSYNEGSKWITALLQPATVALAIPLYRFYPILKKYFVEIILSVLIGSLSAIYLAYLLGKLLKLESTLAHSIIPYSITSPIAMDVANLIGGVPTITAVFVIMTGVLGMIIGPYYIQLFQIKSDIAKGVLLGTTAHGAGTAKALEIGTGAGAVSSVCMILAAIISFIISPWLMSFIL